MDSVQFWEDMHGVFNFALGPAGLIQGEHVCYCLTLCDHVVFTDDSVLVKAQIDDSAQLVCSTAGPPRLEPGPTSRQAAGGKVILRASFQDYDILLRHVSSVKVLQAFTQTKGDVTILDATAAPAFFSGFVPVQRHEALQVAEVFAGGFAGWSRAIAALRDGGVPLHVSWLLERDPSCWPVLQAMDSSLALAETAADIVPSSASGSLLIAADFRDVWWRRAFHLRPVDLAVISPPCQPWSQAGRSQGLHSPDGVLLLEVIEVLRVTEVPVVIFEEVDGFSRHRHFPVFYSAMRSAGYICCWRAPLQLAEVCPASRKRYFLLFAREEAAARVDFKAQVWQALGFPSMLKAQAYFPVLPQGLLQPCLLSHSVMELYMQPDLLPRGPGGRIPRSVQAVRIRSPDQQATCFMAQYHRQHLLPLEHLREKGLLGSLLRTEAGLRFYSAPEIAVSQGANAILKIPHCDQSAMRILGNSLATVQAGFVLGLSLQLFASRLPPVDPQSCVDMCQAATMRSSSTLLLEVEDGWLMCDPAKLGLIMSCNSMRVQINRRLWPSEHQFWPLQVAVGKGPESLHFTLQVSQHLSLELVVDALCLQADMVVPATDQHVARVDCAVPVCWQALGLAACVPCTKPVIIVWSQGTGFLLHRQAPDAFHQLRQVFQTCLPGHPAEVACFDFVGTRQRHFVDLPGIVFLVPDPARLPAEAPWFLEHALQQALPDKADSGFALVVSSESAADWYLSFPAHLFTCAGWRTEFSRFPTEPAQQLRIAVVPFSSTAFTADSVRHWLRNLSFLAPLRVADELCQSSSACADAVSVEVQIVNCTLWQGRLPACMTFADLEALWVQASLTSGCSTAARVFSGPFPVNPEVSMQQASATPKGRYFHRPRSGCLVLSVMPSMHGGGTKDNKAQNLRSRLAQVCLDQGFTLQELNDTVSQLTQRVPHNALAKALDTRQPVQQWAQLQALMQEHNVPEPKAVERSDRVSLRVQTKARRRNLFQDQPTASAFRLAGGFFVNSDGSPAAVLQRLVPQASGVLLLDLPIAKEVLKDYSCRTADELGIICLGHECPEPSSCAQKLRFPAMAVASDTQGHVLLAGCLHQLGERRIKVVVKDVEAIQLAATVPCTFHAFSDEWLDSPTWPQLTESPVKLLLEQFKQAGLALQSVQPWARIFKRNGKNTSPTLADSLQFNAVVPAELLTSLLRQSGHQGAYVTPRDEQGRLRPGWAVVWLSNNKPDAARLSLSVPEQLGLVRSKARWGIRVKDTDFAEVSKRLRPDHVPRSQVSVQLLFKLCPTPLGATESAILQWAEALAWPVRVIEALGPRQWLLGSSQQPPAGWLAFRGETVLTIPVTQKTREQQVVQAGHQHLSAAPQALKDTPVAPQSVDPLQSSDPWRAYYNRTQGLPSTASSATSPVPARVLPEDGPITTKFASQDSRLQSLEEAVRGLQEGQRASEEQRKEDKEEVARSLAGLSQQFAASLEAFQRSHQQQQEQLVSGMAELKSLVVSNRGLPDKKRPAAMDWEPADKH